ncbi:pyruvate kinase [Marinicella sp. S1101]|uniref:pyruvate kinase n=1 Tax=Marinicella marina TaxID=2996016 RepID=UPI0022609366|nr:pyruvate kinase [Marinicella marina]MCX7552899.1 pyruvate kinase [Marinicella marina]MDJ1139792.1 pyruvate kinase [Marinicella marina]
MKRKTKIVATMGPASQAPEQIKALIEAGVNVFRLNFSHGTAADHKRNVDNIRTVAKELGQIVGILQDLQGPKIRVGTFTNGPIKLQMGQNFALHADNDYAGDEAGVGISYNNLHRDVQAKDLLLLDDGKLVLVVTAVVDEIIHTKVKRGGELSNNKGINVPGADLSIAAVTEKDIADIAIGAELDVDWVALSFVRNRNDLLLAKHHLALNNSNAKLMAKIEKPGAVRNYKEILREADGIMVARGDLGVELSAEKVPMLQKRLIRKARQKGKPVITATQMLESMIDQAIPTRAEANDVANAIFDGTDAVMLSAETAMGSFPIEAVKTMDSIAATVETDNDYRKRMIERKFKAEKNTPDAVSSAACHIARTLAAEVMCCFSSSGATALRVARNRIHTDVIAISPSTKSCHQLTVSWGINPVLSNDATSTDEMVEIANRVITEHKMAQPGDQFVITAGVPFGFSGTTNLIRVETLA